MEWRGNNKRGAGDDCPLSAFFLTRNKYPLNSAGYDGWDGDDGGSNKRARRGRYNKQSWYDTFEFTPESYVDVMTEMRVDSDAQRMLFLLAGRGWDGKMAANDIIAKLVEHKTDGMPFRNVSAFVHRACLNARSNM